MRNEITAEIYKTVMNHHAGRTAPHMQPASYDEIVGRYADALLTICDAIDVAGHDHVREALSRRDGAPTRWGDLIRRCISALVGRVYDPTRPLSTFPYIRAVDAMLGANRQDFTRAALEWLTAISRQGREQKVGG